MKRNLIEGLSLLLIVLFFGIIIMSMPTDKNLFSIMRTLDCKSLEADLVCFKDTHGGFLGDGEIFAIISCSKDQAIPLLQESDGWASFPLEKELYQLLYEAEGLQLAKEYGIPYVEEGYFYFVDRHPMAVGSVLNRDSYNFTLALFDSQKGKIYFLEFDS